MGRTVERMLENLNQSIQFNIIYIIRIHVTGNQVLTNKIRRLFLRADFFKFKLFDVLNSQLGNKLRRNVFGQPHAVVCEVKLTTLGEHGGGVDG